MSLSFGGQKQSQSQTSGLDATTTDYLKRIMAAAGASGNAGPSPLLTGAAGYNTGAMNAGNLGLGFLTGDPRAQQALQNPYQSQVVDAMRREGAVTDQNSINAVNDAATRAGAFGGSRHGVAEGVALGENARSLNTNISGLLNSGFQNAQGTALNLAGMGFNAAGANANLGFGGVGSPEQWYLNQLKQGYVQPLGQTTTGKASGGGFGFSLNPFSALGGGIRPMSVDTTGMSFS